VAVQAQGDALADDFGNVLVSHRRRGVSTSPYTARTDGVLGVRFSAAGERSRRSRWLWSSYYALSTCSRNCVLMEYRKFVGPSTLWRFP
jgi:hypothetical protein